MFFNVTFDLVTSCDMMSFYRSIDLSISIDLARFIKTLYQKCRYMSLFTNNAFIAYTFVP